jgi:hypothetical protein
MTPDHERRRDDYWAETDAIYDLARRLRDALRRATLVTGRSQDVHALLAEADKVLPSSARPAQEGTA